MFKRVNEWANAANGALVARWAQTINLLCLDIMSRTQAFLATTAIFAAMYWWVFRYEREHGD